jgi:hypothetical protein
MEIQLTPIELRMLSMNETFTLLDTNLSLIKDKEMSCFVNIKLWFVIHVLVTLFIELIFLYILIIFVFVCSIFVLSYPSWSRSLHTMIENNMLSRYGEENPSHLYATWCLLKKEITLIFVYVLFAVLYRWYGLVNNNNVITSMTFYQWVIEASFAPIVLGIHYSEFGFGDADDIFELNEPYYILAIILKIPLFFLMRYTENNGDCFLNNLKVSLFYIFCK